MMHRFRDPEAGVAGHDPDLLDFALSDLRRAGFRFVSLLDLVRIGRGGGDLSRTVAFTVDDGHADFHRIAAPVFVRHGCPVTVFLATDFLDRKAWLWPDRVRFMMDCTTRESLSLEAGEASMRLEWSGGDAKADATQRLTWALVEMESGSRAAALKALEGWLGVTVPDEVPAAFEPMTWDEVRQDSERGITFGPHTVSHPPMGQLGPSQMEQEILGSWERVQMETTGATPVFCYPFGRRSDCPAIAAEALEKAGFLAAVTAIPGHVGEKSLRRSPFLLPRFPWPDDNGDVRQIAFGLEEAKHMLRSRGRRPGPGPLPS